MKDTGDTCAEASRYRYGVESVLSVTCYLMLWPINEDHACARSLVFGPSERYTLSARADIRRSSIVRRFGLRTAHSLSHTDTGYAYDLTIHQFICIGHTCLFATDDVSLHGGLLATRYVLGSTPSYAMLFSDLLRILSFC